MEESNIKFIIQLKSASLNKDTSCQTKIDRTEKT
jgi:hypothetical protein